MQHRDVEGRVHLTLITSLLQRIRLADDIAGLWEAADHQWSWRTDQHTDPANSHFWFGDDGLPIGCVVFNASSHSLSCDMMAMPNEDELVHRKLWPHAVARIEALGSQPIEMAVRDDDQTSDRLLDGAGFVIVEPRYVSCWMQAAERGALPPLAEGYRLTSAAERGTHAHHMIARNGPHVAERLGECSLYRPELDLCIEAHDGSVAAYGLFWADPITRVGLVEPMRTEDAHQSRGLARHLLAAGLDLLASHGCTRLKVTYLHGNEPARLLYVGAGFVPSTPSHTVRRG